MNHDGVQDWLDRYVACWLSYDEAAIGELFSEDAEYRYQPWGKPVAGREAIVKDWVAPNGDPSKADAPGTFEAAYAPYAMDGDVAVAVGTTTYWKDATRAEVVRAYHNVYLLKFDADAKCRSFTEHYMELSKPKA
ncbi:MAG TPA: nuclear transport factor 2 family protein [Candidatus Limnocylindrales bacterium]|nr:nuclear transport factor 2 family protein [Candidatus Limnocylindrales bacterium]